MITLDSKILNLLGTFFIGSPRALSMPPDFYFTAADRERMTAQDYQDHKAVRARIRVDTFRRELFRRVGLYASALAAIVSVALYVVLRILISL